MTDPITRPQPFCRYVLRTARLRSKPLEMSASARRPTSPHAAVRGGLHAGSLGAAGAQLRGGRARAPR